MNIVLLGMPGSGKGSQAGTLKQNLKLLHFSTGDAFREILSCSQPKMGGQDSASPCEASSKESDLSKKIKDYVNNGLLVPDEIVLEVVKQKISICGQKDFLFDGFPRNVNQAQLFDKYLGTINSSIDKVVYMELPEEISIKRLVARRLCPKCKRGYNLVTQPPKTDEMCDTCNVKLSQRNDDKLETVKDRLEVYKKETSPLIDYYKNKIIKVDATGTIEEVSKQILKKIG
jgi:adenylate kinase